MEYVGNHVYTNTAMLPGDLTLTVNTTYPNAWGRFILESVNRTISGFTFTPITVSENQMKVTISGVSQVIVSEHTIKIQPFILTA
jgi:hypothetical protein